MALLEHQLSSARSKGSGASKIYDSILELLLESKLAFEAYKGGTDTFSLSDKIVCGETGQNPERKLHLSGKTKSENCSKNEKNEKVLNDQKQPVASTDNSGDNSGEYGRNYSAEQDGNNKVGNMTNDDESKEFLNLLQIFEQRLKNCLKEHLKLRTGGKTTASTHEKERENVLKRIFEVTLRASVTRKPETTSPTELCKNVLETIAVIEKLQNNTDIN